MAGMKVYLCGRFSRRREFQAYAEMLAEHGHECTSRWLNEDDEPTDVLLQPDTAAERAHHAMKDIEDIRRSDVLVQFTDEPVEFSPFPNAARGGRHFEAGFAYGQGRFVVFVGPRENIFHWLPGAVVLPQFSDALDWLSETSEWLALDPLED